ncbi:hypothetical protein SADUNF_Sadunf18G0119000 [Salix dunnii]|uniref:Uncharacterized protein n=1 Tax=Salix dunnii TaxID=1413687 RepID=A0A835J4D7_9ROSI|nr:hypothetical protein SADUNF_Sadunf18G0119000 [Salix dunnii]
MRNMSNIEKQVCQLHNFLEEKEQHERYCKGGAAAAWMIIFIISCRFFFFIEGSDCGSLD